MRNTVNRECSCPVGSVTQALRAQRLLSGEGIRAEVIRADPEHSAKGCAYAVSYPCAQERAVSRILQNAGIRFRGGGEVR